MEESLTRLEKKYLDLETILIQFIYLANERFEHMALDFSKLQEAVNNVSANIQTAIGIITNPAVDNNDQATIDQLTGLLNNSASALAAVEPPVQPAPAPAPQPVAQPVPATSADTTLSASGGSSVAAPDSSASSASSSAGDTSPSVSQ